MPDGLIAAPSTTFYPRLEWNVSGLVGTIRVRIIRNSDQSTVVGPQTTGIVEMLGATGEYMATLTAPSVAGAYTILWDNGSLTPGNIGTEDLTVSGTAAALGGPINYRDFIETGLSDASLAVLVADATAEVTARFGTDATITVDLPGRWGTMLKLQRPASAIISVAEYTDQNLLIATLASTDYRLRNNGRILERITGGLWSRVYWAYSVHVVYTPSVESDLRNRVIIDLVRLAVQYDTFDEATVGDVKTKQADYLRERERILMGMSNRRGLRWA